MTCGSCGSNNAYPFYHLGVLSTRCNDCGADLLPGVDMRPGRGYEAGRCSECHKLKMGYITGSSPNCNCPTYLKHLENEQEYYEAMLTEREKK